MIIFLVLRSFQPLNFYCAGGGSHVVMWWGFATAWSSHVQGKVLNISCSWSLLLNLIWGSEFYHTDSSASCRWRSYFYWGMKFVHHDFFWLLQPCQCETIFSLHALGFSALLCFYLLFFFVLFFPLVYGSRFLILQSYMQDWLSVHPHSPLHQAHVSRHSTTEW